MYLAILRVFVRHGDMKLWGIVNLCLLCSILLCSAETVDLINTDGKKISVELVKATEEKVWFKMKGRTNTMSYELTKLDQESRDYIKKWVASGGSASKEFEINVITGKSNQMNKSGDIDDRRYKLEPTLKIKNQSQDVATQAGTATLVFFGKPIKYRGMTCVVDRQQFKLPVIEALEEVELKGKLTSFKYDDVANGEVFGARYRGYVLIVQDSKGKVLYEKSVPSSLMEVSAELAMSLKIGKVYDKYWKPTDDRAVRLR